jgi:hypothetical protein
MPLPTTATVAGALLCAGTTDRPRSQLILTECPHSPAFPFLVSAGGDIPAAATDVVLRTCTSTMRCNKTFSSGNTRRSRLARRGGLAYARQPATGVVVRAEQAERWWRWWWRRIGPQCAGGQHIDTSIHLVAAILIPSMLAIRDWVFAFGLFWTLKMPWRRYLPCKRRERT